MADSQYQSYAEPLADGPYLPAWQPQSVDQVPRRRMLPVAVLAAAAFVSVVAPIPGAENARAAAVIGGNDVIRRVPIVQYTQLAGPVVIPAAAVPAPDLSWRPAYPDFTRSRVSLRTAAQQFLTVWPEPIPNPPEATPDLSWLGTYPAAPPQIPVPLAVRAYLFAFVDTEPVIVVQPIADLRWQPSSPDLLSRQTVTPDQQHAFAFYPVPIAAPVVAELSWAPGYPDLLAYRVVRTALQQTYAANIDPIATAAFVPLSWAPVFPDRLVPRVRRLAGGAVLAPEAPTVAAFLDWLATYPDALPRVLRHPGLVVLPPALAAGALADAVSCLHLSQIAATQATIADLTATQALLRLSAISDETPAAVRVC